MQRPEHARFRALPSVDRLVSAIHERKMADGESRESIVAAARGVLDAARAAIAEGAEPASVEDLVAAAVERLSAARRPALRPVINATGVVIHTNLGRAPLSTDAADAMAVVSARYSNLEFDLESGERGSRQAAVQKLLRELTGAEAALVVNNNASAVLLALLTLAHGKEVAVSRGQAVEIGGGFRVPDVLRQSGARLVEVGTTNRTYVEDYAAAIGPDTAALLHVHPSNFRVLGFTHVVGIADLARLAGERGILAIDDLGSGALLDTAAFGLAHEPTPQESVAAGADVVCFSGDKLVGGPQAGIVVGRADSVGRMQRHPLARAVRIDKASLAGLEATLRHYLRGVAVREIPIWRMIAMPLADLEARARNWQAILASDGISAEVVAAESTIGGGSLPGETLPTRALALRGGQGPGARGQDGVVRDQIVAAHDLARRLRLGQPAVVGRIERDRLLLDPRTVLPDEDAALLEAVRSAWRVE